VDLKQALKEVPKRTTQSEAPDGADAGCGCVDSVYSETLTWELPVGVSAVRLMVSPVTTEGDVLPLGLTTGIVQDATVNTTTTAVPVPTTTTLPKARIQGKIKMTVPDVQAFISDPKVKTAMANSIAEMAGVPADYVTVIITAARRLRGWHDEEYKRRLAAGGVNIDYTIDIPQGSSVEASALESKVQNTQPTAFLAIVNKQLTAVGSNMAVTSVESITAEQVAVGPATPKPRTVTVKEDDDGAPVAGIVIGILAAVCCVCGLAGAGFWYFRKQQGGPEELEVGTRAVTVMPAPNPSKVVVQPVHDAPPLPGVPAP